MRSWRLGLQHDVVLLAVLDEGRDPPRAHHRLERRADLLGRDAEVRGAIEVDLDAHLRPRLLVVGVRVVQPGILRHTLEHPVAPDGELRVVRAAQHELQRLPGAAHEAAEDPRRRANRRDRAELRAQFLHGSNGTTRIA